MEMSKTKNEITVWWPQTNGVEPHEVEIFTDAELIDIMHGTLIFSPAFSNGEKVILNGIPWRVKQTKVVKP